VGKPPFKSKDLSVLYQKIVAEDAVLPNNLSAVSRSLLRGLLSRNPGLRLGAQGVQQVREHQWFSTCDWPKLALKAIPPVYQPLSPADYLCKVISSVNDDGKGDSTIAAKADTNIETSLEVEQQGPLDDELLSSPRAAAVPSAKASSPEEIPDYLNRIVQLIEKWQLRILATPMDSTAKTAESVRHSTGSWRPTPLAAVALESPITRVTAHKHKRAISNPSLLKGQLRNLLQEGLEEQLTPLSSPIAKPINSSGLLHAMSPVPPITGEDPETPDVLILPEKQPTGTNGEPHSSTFLTPMSPATPLHGLLFGHEVEQLQGILQEMQDTMQAQAGEMQELKIRIRDVTAERDVLRSKPKISGGGEELGHALAIAMEETESLVSLAHKMATAMSNSVGPGTDDIKDILTEAQKLMGLAREEKAQAEKERATRHDAIEEAKQERDKKERMEGLQMQFASTEEGYIQAMVESQQTLATAAAERDALLQLASKLEEHSRMQAQREGDLVDSLADKCKQLERSTAEVRLMKAEQSKDKGEQQKMKAQIAELKAKLQQYNAFDAALEAYGEDSSSEDSDVHDNDEEEAVVPEGEDLDPHGDGKKKGLKGWLGGFFSGLARNSSHGGSNDEEDEEYGMGQESGGNRGDRRSLEEEDEEQRLSTPRGSDPTASEQADALDANFEAFMENRGTAEQPGMDQGMRAAEAGERKAQRSSPKGKSSRVGKKSSPPKGKIGKDRDVRVDTSRS